MQAFEYANPSTLQEALGLLGSQWGETDVLAGGTDQITLMKEYLHTPKRVVNIKNLKELRGINKTNAGLRIGAAVTLDELASNPGIRSEFPSLTTAALGVASPQIRNMGTVGGDLCQRPRCWYFRQGFGLLAMKDGKSLVPNGENRYHAIFGEGPAYFVSASSLGPALVALNAQVKLVSASGPRTLPVEQFFVVPRDQNAREIALHPNEILTEILIPPANGAKNATYEVRHKEALDWPLATASVSLGSGGARIVLGHVAPAPWVAAEAAKMAGTQGMTEELAQKVAEAAVAGAKPLSQNAYKVQLARVAVKRALLTASGKA